MTTNKKQPSNNDNNRQHNRQNSSSKRSDGIDSNRTNRYRKDFKFHCRPYSNTADGQLISYLQQGDNVHSSKEMVLQALRMCWLPLAYKAQSGAGISDQEVRRIGLICCHALDQHLAYLRIELGLPHKSSDVLPVPLSTMTNPQTLAAMFGLDVGNPSSDDSSNKNQDSTNSNSSSDSQRIDSDSFIPGEGSFHDDDDDMFADI
ncbi:hypothetical protein H6G54_29540 [Anabaena cylindrica FACHB-243]|uniref:Uncharacterized protein n=1 Tax=Anabaena cylindrica (strain ATCC 27899 / PCC 7122) TaxID=272123 RepID=K9ZP64_ANACC|nr:MULTISPECIES: hypothetical protein [Anabaena]AFZ61028.1 hypothetical protein Anacy_5727 [Anabaena cylindrica PCC 7122]MBD2421746.1 hypothetical protein [Anabaena cylindrica FACHB-243]MBY5281487.1 hypothetical protein [Anabaena sp. CCAP 1446/1C]MBY5309547.1 hypothetical protein [Anabaena sp. CCAP 1446/1C]MCM2408980.1 hypothetical protein [Anabaena sp. CCAP 1446/1C]